MTSPAPGRTTLGTMLAAGALDEADLERLILQSLNTAARARLVRRMLLVRVCTGTVVRA